MTADERLDAAFGEGFTAEARAEVQREHAERYVQTRAVIEFADTRMVLTRSHAWDDPDMPGAVKVGRSGRDAVQLQETDWNRIVAVARGHVSDAAARVIAQVTAGDLAGGVELPPRGLRAATRVAAQERGLDMDGLRSAAQAYAEAHSLLAETHSSHQRAVVVERLNDLAKAALTPHPDSGEGRKP